MDAKLTLNPKQFRAFHYLEDDKTNFVLYGGGAAGGKSWLGCGWIIVASLKYPGTVSMIGRSKLKTLKTTTLITFYKVAKHVGLKSGEDFVYNDSNHKQYPNSLVFFNDSIVYLKDLFLYPKDPEFDDLGSMELTRVFIDEANQVTVKARNISFSRIREKLQENNLIPKMLMTCNPAKNWTYADYYKPSKEGILAPNKKFIPALIGDNPFVDPTYKAALNELSENEQQRLKYGNWDYDDDPARLINFNRISDLFTNEHINGDERFISADIALHGSDKFVVMVWAGFRVIHLEDFPKIEAQEVELKLKALATEFEVPRSNIVYDADGLGSYLRSYLAGAVPFVNNARPLEENNITPNYKNLKTQCTFKMAEMVEAAQVYIKDFTSEQRDFIIEELSFVKKLNTDRDQKLQILQKDVIKEQIGRSPDFSDTIMMRMYFEIDRAKVTKVITKSSGDRLVQGRGYFERGEYDVFDRY